MDLYFELLKKPVFTPTDVLSLYDNEGAARSALHRLIEKGRVLKIRNGLYTCLSGETLSPLASKEQIASKITSSSFLSHHSAMEYHALYEQVHYEVQVSSLTSFRDFSFNGYRYRYVHAAFLDGVIEPPYGGGVRVSDLERTLLDVLSDLNKLVGLEEALGFIEDLSSIDEGKLLEYLPKYRSKFMYQKVGFLLYPHRKRLHLSPSFFKECELRKGDSKRYLTGEAGTLEKKWGLIVSEDFTKREKGYDYEERI